MKRAALFMALAAVILAAGCLQRAGGGASPFVEDYKNGLIWTSPAQAEDCRIGSCWCYVCKNTSTIFGPMKSLMGGYCYFEKNCTSNVTSFLENGSSSDLDLRRFMIGQGPSFYDFGNAQPYCSYRMGMAVHWLVGSNETPYTLPSAGRAMCFLSKDVIPMYVLYSRGQDINVSRAREIGHILGTEGANYFLGLYSSGPVGPVIVVTEIDFNASNASLVADEVRAINDECNPNRRTSNRVYCQVAVAPKINDYAALDAVMDDLASTDDLDDVDLIAYGVNSHYVHSCDIQQVNEEIVEFARYSLYNWSKPSVIPYVMFEPNASDAGDTCQWSEEDVVDGYAFFFPDVIQELAKRGGVGLAAYSFNGTSSPNSNPLGCKNCDVAASPERLRAWYGGCQAYANVTGTKEHPSPGVPILFPNESGGYCGGQAENGDFLASWTFGTAGDRNILARQQPQLGPAMNKVYSCDQCLIMNTSMATLYDFGSSPAITPKQCTSYPELDRWAGVRNLDPMLVRAFVIPESSFDPCSAPQVRSGQECYSIGYDSMSDPAGTCTFTPSNTNPPTWRFCGLGIMQVIEPPYTFWPATHTPDGQDGQFYDVFSRSGLKTAAALDAAKACDPQFNPFNVSDAACLGTAKMEFNLKRAHAWVRSHNTAFNLTLREIDGGSDKAEVLAAYISAHMYTGDWDQAVSSSFSSVYPSCSPTAYTSSGGTRARTNGECWTDSFYQSRIITTTYCSSDAGRQDPTQACRDGRPYDNQYDHCYGYTDFAKFVRLCRAPFIPIRRDRAAEKMSYYFSLAKNCPNSFCPDGKNLMTAICQPGPDGKVNTQYCIGPGVPKVPSSGSFYIPNP